jgi:hypothetical protein
MTRKAGSLSTTPIWFDPEYRSNSTDLTGIIKAFGCYLEEQEAAMKMRSRARTIPAKRSFRLAVEAMSCNLILAEMAQGSARVVLPLAHGRMWGGGRYGNPVYGQHFLHIIDLLIRLKLIRQIARGYRVSPKHKALSLYQPTKALFKRLPLDGLDWRSFQREQSKELVILKSDKDEDRKSTPIDYSDSKNTRQWRGQIKRINKWLAAADVDLLDHGQILSVSDDGEIIAPFQMSLRRIFNNGSWRQGGRLFGGFWMSMKKEDRQQRIRIGGEIIEEVDYDQLYPTLAYVRARAEMPDGDFYDIAGDGSSRAGWKILVNAMLFAEKRLGSWPKNTKIHFPGELKLRDAVRMVEKKHAPLIPLFGTGIGYELMYFESEMLIAVISHLFENGIVALPLHDAVLVSRSNAKAAQNAMQDEFTHRTYSRRATVSIKVMSN